MHDLSIDIETYCDVPIASAGAYRYIADPSFEILLFAYSIDGAYPVCVDLTAGEQVPGEILHALTDPGVTKHAYNAAFEFAALSKVFGPMDAKQWRCTMVHGLYAGYTAGLEATGAAVGLPNDKQKLTTGKALIRYFCVPCKPTKANGGRIRNLPKHDPEKWELFKTYNLQDVVAEMEIEKRLRGFPVPDYVWHQWETDLAINSRGVRVDMKLVEGALSIGAELKQELTDEAKKLSGLDNPNSVSQLTDWLSEQGIDTSDLRKDTVSAILKEEDVDQRSKRMLQIRQELGKTSTKKYDAIAECVCPDGRVRGLLQFYGANRTGRYAGRLVQVQNLPRTYTKPTDLARRYVKEKNGRALGVLFGSVNDTLSQLVRTAFVASPGKVLIDADFSAIEARVISWLAGEEWRLQAFRDGKDIYCESASQMFGVPVEKHGVNGELRQKGKVAELALGYQGSTGAMITMGALDMGLHEDELPEIVAKWRAANPKIQQLWWDMDDAARATVEFGGTDKVSKVMLSREFDSAQGKHVLSITLPSGRKLYYIDPAITENRYGKPSVVYMGVDQQTRKWVDIETYGGKLVENITQAVARDCLAEAIDRLEAAGFPIVFHVHDEVVIEIEPYTSNEQMLADVVRIMSEVPKWAEGLPLAADGWVGDYFTKD